MTYSAAVLRKIPDFVSQNIHDEEAKHGALSLSSYGWLNQLFKIDSAEPAATAKAQTMEIIGDVHPAAVTPNDPQFASQWHLNGPNGINVQGVWDDYRGNGITIGFIDDGIQFTHPDLDGNYNTAIDYDSATGAADGSPKATADKHGTTTSGIAAAEGNNALGVTGVAYESDVTSWRINFSGSLTDAMLGNLFNRAAGVDVVNNSWGFTSMFADNLNAVFPTARNELVEATSLGRGGLGTNIVFAAGNSRESGDNTNYHNFQNSKYIITVGATDAAGKYTYFSTPGASLLVSAPGYNMTSTDRTGSAGYVSGDYATGLAGTSYSAPVVSGVVALMLDANPNLGWRDVQEILAYSARNSDAAHAGWKINGATNWNGGGMHFSHDYGYGLVNAHDAVRLAETWLTQSTTANMASVDTGLMNVNATITDNNVNGISRTANFSGTNLMIDRVEIDVNIAHTWIGDLRVLLISPYGTQSVLVNRPGINPDNPSGYGSSADNISNFTLTSNAFWGEMGDGAWTIKVIDVDSGYVGTFGSWRLRLYGDNDSANDVFIYTDEFSNVASAARTTLTDASGTDTINAAAVTSNTVLSLIDGTNSTIDGVTLAIAPGTVIENAFTGDGNDTVIGNAVANVIDSGRGNDIVEGGAGNDTLRGGLGIDTARYFGAFIDYLISIIDAVTLMVQDNNVANGDEGTDTLTGFEKLLFDGIAYLFNGTSVDIAGNTAPVAQNDSGTMAQEQAVTINVLANDSDGDGDALQISGIATGPAHGTAVVNANNTITYTPDAEWYGSDSFNYNISDGNGGTATAQVNVTVTQAPGQTLNGNNLANNINGGAGNDTINANGGNDTVHGNGGNDAINGGSGDDTLYGDNGNDVIHGNAGNDTMYGGNGNDTIYSDGGTDYFIGGAGADTLIGYSTGKDTFIYQNMGDAGDLVQSFRRSQDVLDLRQLFDSLGYAGSNPVADGYLKLQTAPGNDLQVLIDTDGTAGPATFTLLLTLDNVTFTALTAGTDYLVQ